MTVKEFLLDMQSYYGMKYQEGSAKRLIQYLETYTDQALDVLADLTVKTYSGRYKALPDIAIWEALKKDVREQLEGRPADMSLLELEDKSELASPEIITGMVNKLLKRGQSCTAEHGR